MSSPLPFTIITGFLGAGKTTLLRRLLSAEHGHRLAVIINEFGEIGIDGDLVLDAADGGIVEMNNGCVCCEVRDDLAKSVGELLERRRNGSLSFDHLVMETTGIARPGPIVQTLATGALKQAVSLNGVVTVVDAYHASGQLDEFVEAQEQVGVADLIILNKTDLVEAEVLNQMTGRLAAINGQAQTRQVTNCDIEVDMVLDLEKHSMQAFDEHHTHDHDNSLHAAHHHHLDGVSSISIEISEPMDHGSLMDWFSYLIIGYADQLLRYKGILNIKGQDSRIIFQGLHSLFEARPEREWRADEKRTTRLVFIGRDLPEKIIREEILDCIAQ